MIAVMNQANFIAILLSGVIYSLFDRWVKAQAWPRSYIFAMMAMLILPMAIFYRPKNSPA
jgi:acyl-[acyl-carrier-protein]-phospholipid O-acyltransferase/long-chain-fatty-acid--[acyl-carrier-protein] ligase